MSTFKSVNKNSVVELRNATDEKLPIVLSSLGYTESFKLTDIRLALGYVSAIIAALTFYVEKKIKFQDAIPYTSILVALYFFISGLTYLHSKFIEKDTIYMGTSKDTILHINGKIDKYIPEYNLSFTIQTKGNKPIIFKKVLKFTQIFDMFGNLHENQLTEWVKTTLETNSKTK